MKSRKDQRGNKMTRTKSGFCRLPATVPRIAATGLFNISNNIYWNHKFIKLFKQGKYNVTTIFRMFENEIHKPVKTTAVRLWLFKIIIILIAEFVARIFDKSVYFTKPLSNHLRRQLTMARKLLLVINKIVSSTSNSDHNLIFGKLHLAIAMLKLRGLQVLKINTGIEKRRGEWNFFKELERAGGLLQNTDITCDYFRFMFLASRANQCYQKATEAQQAALIGQAFSDLTSFEHFQEHLITLQRAHIQIETMFDLLVKMYNSFHYDIIHFESHISLYCAVNHLQYVRAVLKIINVYALLDILPPEDALLFIKQRNYALVQFEESQANLKASGIFAEYDDRDFIRNLSLVAPVLQSESVIENESFSTDSKSGDIERTDNVGNAKQKRLLTKKKRDKLRTYLGINQPKTTIENEGKANNKPDTRQCTDELHSSDYGSKSSHEETDEDDTNDWTSSLKHEKAEKTHTKKKHREGTSTSIKLMNGRQDKLSSSNLESSDYKSGSSDSSGSGNDSSFASTDINLQG